MNTNDLDNAAMILAATAEYDHRFAGLTDQDAESKTQAWAAQLAGRGLTTNDLLEGVRRAYSTPDRPLNPIGSIITEAKTVLRDRRQKETARELAITAGEKHTVHGPALPRAYQVDDAINIACPTCPAQPGETCEDTKHGERRIPHVPRLALAFRHNNPRGKLYKAHRRHKTPQTTNHPNQAA